MNSKLKKLIKEEVTKVFSEKKLRTESKYPDTAEEYAKELNQKAAAQRTNSPGDWHGELVTDPKHWAESDIYTGEDLARGLAADEYSDTYKEIYGIRPHIAWKHMPVEDLEEMIEELRREAGRDENDSGMRQKAISDVIPEK